MQRNTSRKGYSYVPMNADAPFVFDDKPTHWLRLRAFGRAIKGLLAFIFCNFILG